MAGLFFYAAVPAGAATLEEAVRQAVRDYPAIGEAVANRRATQQELRQARGLFLPQVDLRAGIGPSYVNNEVTRARAGVAPNEDNWETGIRREAALTLQQLIYDGGAAASEVERQQSRVDAAALRVLERSEVVALDAVQAYLDVLRHQALVELAERNIAAHEGTLGDVQSRLRAGRGPASDVAQAESRLAAARAERVEAARRLDEAVATYRRFVGAAPEDLARPGVPAAAPASEEAAVEAALLANPTLASARADIQVAEAEHRATRAPFLPRVTLDLQAFEQRGSNQTLNKTQELTAMVMARYNLYRGGIDAAARMEAAERIGQTRARLDTLEREVAEATRQTFATTRRTRERVGVLAGQVAANERVRDAYREEFGIGQRSLLDVLDSENELFLAQSTLASTEYAALFADYRLLAVTGALLDAIGVEPPAESVALARAEDGVAQGPARP